MQANQSRQNLMISYLIESQQKVSAKQSVETFAPASYDINLQIAETEARLAELKKQQASLGNSESQRAQSKAESMAEAIVIAEKILENQPITNLTELKAIRHSPFL
jgi:hypothetical protein